MLKFFRDSDGDACLGFVCDLCKKPITDGHMAGIIRQRPNRGDFQAEETELAEGQSALMFHKLTCDPLLNTPEDKSSGSWHEFGQGIKDALQMAGLQCTFK